MKDFADNKFKFDKNGRKLSKRVENTVGQGEIARYEQFSFSHSVFKRLVTQGRQKVSLCGNGLRQLLIVSGVHVLKLFTKHQNFRLVQIESFCRRQNRCDSKVKVCFEPGYEKTFLEKETMLVTSIFSFFPKCF